MTAGTAVGTHLPESVRARRALPSVDESNNFSLSTEARAAPERWAERYSATRSATRKF
jgi:hypothetical protein